MTQRTDRARGGGTVPPEGESMITPADIIIDKTLQEYASLLRIALAARDMRAKQKACHLGAPTRTYAKFRSAEEKLDKLLEKHAKLLDRLRGV